MYKTRIILLYGFLRIISKSGKFTSNYPLQTTDDDEAVIQSD